MIKDFVVPYNTENKSYYLYHEKSGLFSPCVSHFHNANLEFWCKVSPHDIELGLFKFTNLIRPALFSEVEFHMFYANEDYIVRGPNVIHGDTIVSRVWFNSQKTVFFKTRKSLFMQENPGYAVTTHDPDVEYCLSLKQRDSFLYESDLIEERPYVAKKQTFI